MNPGDRISRIWTAVALRAHRAGSPISAQQVCLACVDALALSGAGLVLATKMNFLEPMCITDSRAGEIEQVQATIGEGPGIDALLSGRPVLVDDMASPASTRRWPVFAPEVSRLEVRAMYSLPLALGAIRLGVLNLYHDSPAELGHDQLVDALVYADTALLLVVNERSGITTSLNGDQAADYAPALWHAEVHQAAGMVSVQLGIPVFDALVRLRAHAYSHDQPLAHVARAVVERRLRFHSNDARPTFDRGQEGQP